ncbi:MAG: hypothetical protein K9I74_05800 [Bacteroidales bacterium]|nr:hypothetical protein [Bacteroidales bacterium]
MQKTDRIINALVRQLAQYMRKNWEIENSNKYVEQEREEQTSQFEKLRSELRESSQQNAELKEFISDYKQQIEDMEQRLQSMEQQRKKQKETVDNLMAENLDLKKQIAALKGEENQEEE